MPKIDQYWISTELYYTAEHTWARIGDGDAVKVGIDDYASKTAGEILFVELPSIGQLVEQMKSFGQIETAKWVGELHAPFTGQIIAANQEAAKNPKLINEDPYGAGWLVEIKPTRLDEEISKLLHGDSAVEWLKKEIEAKKSQAP
jgi:glycine cleavage system H protein